MPSFSGTCFLPRSLELRASTRQASLDRFLASARQCRYFRRALVLPIAPSQEDAIVLPNSPEDCYRPVARPVAIHDLGQVLIRLEIQRSHVVELRFPQYQPVMVLHLVPRDAEQPRMNRRFAGKRADALERG